MIMKPRLQTGLFHFNIVVREVFFLSRKIIIVLGLAPLPQASAVPRLPVR